MLAGKNVEQQAVIGFSVDEVAQALPADGTLLLAEPMAGTSGAEAMGDAYFGFYLLAMGHGRPRTPGELESMLRSAGFGRLSWVPTRIPLQTRLLVAILWERLTRMPKQFFWPVDPAVDHLKGHTDAHKVP